MLSRRNPLREVTYKLTASKATLIMFLGLFIIFLGLFLNDLR